MARYVVVEFANNEDAQFFINEAAFLNEQERRDRQPFVRRVVGVFVKPVKTCSCVDWNRANYGDKNHKFAEIQRGEKFGWWVCSRCNRPRKGGHQLVNQLLPSETFEGVESEGYEMSVTNLGVSSFARGQIDRPKKLRRKKVKK